MKLLSICFALIFLIGLESYAQSSFKFRRGIEGVRQEGWYSLTLPDDIFMDLNKDLTDLRLYTLNGEDTVENPYLLKIRNDVLTSEIVQLKAMNHSYSLGSLSLMFELSPGQQVNFLGLSFWEKNFFAWATLHGSDDRKEWFEIFKDQRIAHVTKRGVDYSLSGITFPVTDYRYLHLRVRADVSLTFESAFFEHKIVKPGEFRTVPLTWQNRLDKKGRQSIMDVRLENYVPVSSIEVTADNRSDYYRPLRIEYVADSFKTDNGWMRSYETVYEGYLTSLRPNVFSFPHTLARDIRLVISDLDNAPVSINNVSVKGPKATITTYLKPGTNFMLYGAGDVRSPAYDLAYFSNKIPGSLGSAELGAAETLTIPQVQTKPIFESQWWLWSVMVVLIGGLAFFTLKMMRQKPQVTPK